MMADQPQSGATPHPIYYYAERNDLNGVAQVLQEKPVAINQQDPETGMTALHWAGANRNLRLGEMLFGQEIPRVDPWIKDRWDRLPAELAIKTGNESLIDLFHRMMFREDYEPEIDLDDLLTQQLETKRRPPPDKGT